MECAARSATDRIGSSSSQTSADAVSASQIVCMSGSAGCVLADRLTEHLGIDSLQFIEGPRSWLETAATSWFAQWPTGHRPSRETDFYNVVEDDARGCGNRSHQFEHQI